VHQVLGLEGLPIVVSTWRCAVEGYVKYTSRLSASAAMPDAAREVGAIDIGEQQAERGARSSRYTEVRVSKGSGRPVQNRSVPDRIGVIEGLERDGSPRACAMADVVRHATGR
jgi:hypothetical protein